MPEESTPRVDERGWLVLHPLQLVLPNRCCRCEQPTGERRKFEVTRKRSWGSAIAWALVGLVVGVHVHESYTSTAPSPGSTATISAPIAWCAA
jgi:hypothetical protein